VSPEEYIEAIIQGDANDLIKGVLTYRPSFPVRVPLYDHLSKTLVSA